MPLETSAVPTACYPPLPAVRASRPHVLRARRQVGRPHHARRATTALLAGVGAFEVALAAGVPWGSAAWGGAHPGVLPTNLRAASGVAAVVYGGLAFLAGSDVLGATARRRVLGSASAIMVVGTLLNLASPSMVEKVLMTPVAASLAMLLWRTRRDRDEPSV